MSSTRPAVRSGNSNARTCKLDSDSRAQHLLFVAVRSPLLIEKKLRQTSRLTWYRLVVSRFSSYYLIRHTVWCCFRTDQRSCRQSCRPPLTAIGSCARQLATLEPQASDSVSRLLPPIRSIVTLPHIVLIRMLKLLVDCMRVALLERWRRPLTVSGTCSVLACATSRNFDVANTTTQWWLAEDLNKPNIY